MSIGGSRKWLTFLVCGQIATAGLIFGGLVFGASDEFERSRILWPIPQKWSLNSGFWL